MRSKETAINFLTAFFALIILFVHHGFYTTNRLPLNPLLFNLLVYFAVGGFVFFSAYKLTKSKLGDTFAAFWKNRLLRIYPLYVLAIISYVIVIYPDVSFLNLIKHLLCVQILIPQFFGPNFLTLYFVSLIFFYYLFFSLAKPYLKKPIIFLLLHFSVLVIIWGLFLITKHSIQLIEPRLILYLNMFSGGMLFAYYENKLPKWSLITGFAGLLMPMLYFVFLASIKLIRPEDFYSQPGLSTFLIVPGFIMLYYSFMNLPLKLNWFTIISNFIADASFAIYLLHRPIWQIMRYLSPQYSVPQSLFIIIFGVPLIIAVSFIIQSQYNLAINKLIKNKPVKL